MDQPTISDADRPRAAAPTMTALAWALVALLVLSGIINYVDRQTLSTLGPTICREFELSAQRWGWVNSAFAIVYIVSSLLGGAWIDRVGVRTGLLAATAFWSCAAAGHALAHDFWSLCFWRMMLAIGEGAGGGALLKGVRRLMTPTLRDTGTALMGAGWAAGALIAPLIAGAVTRQWGWRSAFLVTGALCLLWIPPWIALAWRRRSPLGPGALAIASAGDAGAPGGSWRAYGVCATLIAIFAAVPPTVFVNVFLPKYLSDTWGLDQTRVARVYWQPFLATDIGQLIGGFAALALLRRGWRFLAARTLIIGLGFAGAAVIVLARWSATAEQALALIDCSRLCHQAGYILVLAYGMEAVSERRTGLMSGLMNATFSACNFVFSPLIGWLVDRGHGYDQVLLLIALSPLAAYAAWVALSRREARRPA